jgi:hypothetical protein
MGQRARPPFNNSTFVLNPNSSFFCFRFNDLKGLQHDVRIYGTAVSGRQTYFNVEGALDAPTNSNSAYGALCETLINAGFQITTGPPGEYLIGTYKVRKEGARTCYHVTSSQGRKLWRTASFSTPIAKKSEAYALPLVEEEASPVLFEGSQRIAEGKTISNYHRLRLQAGSAAIPGPPNVYAKRLRPSIVGEPPTQTFGADMVSAILL